MSVLARRSACPLLAAAAFLACGEGRDSAARSADAFVVHGAVRADSVVFDAMPMAVELEQDTTFPADGRNAPVNEILYRVRTVLPRRDGGLYLVNAGNHEVLAVDANGALLWRFGRRGPGPGEFSSLGNIQLWRGDSIAVVDQVRNAVTILDDAGIFARTRTFAPLRTPVRPPGSGQFLISTTGLPIGLLPDERIVILGPESALRSGSPGLRHIRTALTTMDTTGHVVELMALQGGLVYESPAAETFGVAGFAPMSTSVAIAVGDDGHVMASRDAYALHVLDHDGTVRRVFHVRALPEPVTPELRADYLENSGWRTWTEVADSIPFPERLPAFDRVLLSAGDGSVWARRFTWGRRPEEWLRFDVRAYTVQRFRLPARMSLRAATGDAVFAVHRDELDVERLVRLHLPVVER